MLSSSTGPQGIANQNQFMIRAERKMPSKREQLLFLSKIHNNLHIECVHMFYQTQQDILLKGTI